MYRGIDAPNSSLSSPNHGNASDHKRSHWNEQPLNSSMDKELQKGTDFQSVHSSYKAGLWGYMAADRMRRGHELFTLRGWGHPEKAVFVWRSWQTSLVPCLPWKRSSKKPFKCPSMVAGPSVWMSRIECFCCYLLPLNRSYSCLNLWLASWLLGNLWLITSGSPLHLSGQLFALTSRNTDTNPSLTTSLQGNKWDCAPPVWVTLWCGVGWSSAALQIAQDGWAVKAKM